MKLKDSISIINKSLLTILIISSLSSCAESPSIQDCIKDDPYGFFGGLWHGIIAPVSFIGSLLSDNIAMYAVNNNGGWYDLGFVLGAGILFGGGSKASKR